MQRSNLQTIAELAQVSPSTVSRVLSGKNKRETAQGGRILKLAEELGYKRDFIAKSMRTGRTFMIGVLISDISGSFYPKIVLAIQDTLIEHGYSILLSNSKENAEREAKSLHNFVERRVEAIIISPIQDEVNENYFLELKKHGIPFVVIDRHYPYVNCDFVGVDDRHGAYLAGKHLIGLGHERMGVIAGPLNTYTGKERLQGFKDALLEHGLELKQEYMVEGSYSPGIGSGRKKVKELIAQARDITAIFCSGDPLAIGALRGLREMNINVPEDISLVGFAGIPETEFVEPPLTTVQQPMYEIGKESASLVLRKIEEVREGEEARKETRLLKTELVIRNSTAKPRRTVLLKI